MKPLGEMQKTPKKALDPKVEPQSPSRALNQHSHELHDLRKKLLLPLDGKLSPAVLLRRLSLAGKPSPGRITLHCPGPLCFNTSRGNPLPCISTWRTIQGATSSHHGVKPLGIQKTSVFQLFHTNSEEELPGSQPHRGQGPSAPLLGGREVFHSIPQHGGVSSLPRITLISA